MNLLKILDLPEKNGLKAKQVVNYKKYILYGLLGYAFFAFLMFHTYAWKAYDPMLSFTEALTKGMGSMSSHPLQVVAYPGSDYATALFCGFIVILCGGWYTWLRHKQASELMLAGTHGTMHFNNKISQYNKQYTDPPGSPNNNGPKNMIFTDNVFMSMDTKATRRNLNVLVVGGSGSGKSRFVVKPNLCQMPINCNFICTDPSGELMADTGKMLESYGYKVKCFNLVNMSKSDTYNPLEYIHTENDVILLVDCLLANTSDPNKKGGDDFWEKAMKLMLQSFIFLLWLHGDELGLEKTLNGVMSLLDGCFIEGGDDDETSSTMSNTDILFAMVQYGYIADENGRLKYAEDGTPMVGHSRRGPTPEQIYDNAYGMDISVKQYRKFKSSGTGKTFQNMLISAAARFSNFDIQSLVDLTSSNSIDLESLGDEKSVLFVTLPQENESFNFMAALLYSQLFQVLYYRAENDCQGNYLIKDANGEIVRVYEIHHTHDTSSDVDEDEELYNSLDDWIEEDLSEEDEDSKKKGKMSKRSSLKIKKSRGKKSDPDPVPDPDQQIDVMSEREDDESLQVNEDPGNVDDKSIEREANRMVEDLKKSVKLVKSKKSDLYAIRFRSSETRKDEILGIYGNREYAVKRASALKNCTVSRCGLHLPYHVRFLLDEFANIGSIPNFTKLLATMRKYELSCTIILQNLAQIKNMYDKDWGSIVGNCDSTLLLGSSEYDTQEYFSKKLGKTTVKTRNTSVSHGGKGSSSQSMQQAARELMLPEEIGQMSDSECILIIRGVYPFRDAKYRYERHPNYKYTADGSKANLYKFSPGKNNSIVLPTLKQPYAPVKTDDIKVERPASPEKPKATPGRAAASKSIAPKASPVASNAPESAPVKSERLVGFDNMFDETVVRPSDSSLDSTSFYKPSTFTLAKKSKKNASSTPAADKTPEPATKGGLKGGLNDESVAVELPIMEPDIDMSDSYPDPDMMGMGNIPEDSVTAM